MKIGYARASKNEKNIQAQFDALNKDGCVKIYFDRLNGIVRPALEEALFYARERDTLVVWSFQRLSRSTHEFVKIVNKLSHEGIHFRSIHERIDTTTSHGKSIFETFLRLSNRTKGKQ